MRIRSLALPLASAVAMMTQVAAPAPAPPAFDEILELSGISFHVTAPNDGSSPGLEIVPSGLEIVNDPIEHDIAGIVVAAEVADLNSDGSPEIYVFVRSEQRGAAGSVVAYSANNRKSLSAVYLPPITNEPQALVGYRGGDEFAVIENTFARRFPIYRDGDADGSPTGGTRQLQYKLGRGEAGWVLRLDKSVEF